MKYTTQRRLSFKKECASEYVSYSSEYLNSVNCALQMTIHFSHNRLKRCMYSALRFMVSSFPYRKPQDVFWVLWILGGYGYWFCVDQSKFSMAHTEPKLRCWLLCWTVDVSALCFSAVLFAWRYCVLLGSLGWLWVFRICSTKQMNLLWTLYAGVHRADMGLTWDAGRFGVGSWKNGRSCPRHAFCFQTVADRP